MKGELSASFAKRGGTRPRTLHPDRVYLSPARKPSACRAAPAAGPQRRSSHDHRPRAVDGEEAPEGLDALVTSTIALHDLRGGGTLRNSRAGSIYIVKPKMHGPEEVAFASGVFAFVETRWGWRPTRSRWASWTRSGAPRSTSRRPFAPLGPVCSSSTPVFSTAPATRSTPPCWPVPSSARTT